MSPIMWLYGLPLLFILLIYLWKRSAKQQKSKHIYAETVSTILIIYLISQQLNSNSLLGRRTRLIRSVSNI